MAAPATLSWVGGEPENLAYVLSIDNAGACISCRFASTCWTVKVFLPLMSAMDTTLLLMTSTGDAKAELMSDATRAKCELKCILCKYGMDTSEKMGLFARGREVACLETASGVRMDRCFITPRGNANVPWLALTVPG